MPFWNLFFAPRFPLAYRLRTDRRPPLFWSLGGLTLRCLRPGLDDLPRRAPGLDDLPRRAPGLEDRPRRPGLDDLPRRAPGLLDRPLAPGLDDRPRRPGLLDLERFIASLLPLRVLRI